MTKKLFFSLWILFSVVVLFYSYTQVDLSLTFSRSAVYLSLEKIFQYIGYFNRPLSTYIFCTIVVTGFVFYGFSLRWIAQKKITGYQIGFVTIIIGGILLLSYNAFSYDIFNYIFDAKIISHYHQNPYLHHALDFPGDPMLSFMHWTHRVYPYGPFWLLLTVPLTFLGMNYFIVTFFLFKVLAVFSFFASVYFIKKIAEFTKIISPSVAVAFFALNPLVIIESLVSAHNDIVMIAIALVSMYFLLKKKYFSSWLELFISIGIKFATAYLIPAYIYQFITRQKKTNYFIFFLISVFCSIAAIIAVSLRTNFQPWYLLYSIPFAAFISNKKYILISTSIISFFSLMQYVPFLYTGNWNPPIPTILNWMLYCSIIVSVIVIGVSYQSSKFKNFIRHSI